MQVFMPVLLHCSPTGDGKHQRSCNLGQDCDPAEHADILRCQRIGHHTGDGREVRERDPGCDRSPTGRCSAGRTWMTREDECDDDSGEHRDDRSGPHHWLRRRIDAASGMVCVVEHERGSVRHRCCVEDSVTASFGVHIFSGSLAIRLIVYLTVRYQVAMPESARDSLDGRSSAHVSQR